MGFEVGAIVLLILFYGLLSMAELAVINSRKGRLQQLAEEGSKAAARALELAQPGRNLLATLQICITLSAALTGALAALFFTWPLSSWLGLFIPSGWHLNAAAFGLIFLLVAAALILLGELVPKRLAVNNPEGLALLLATPAYELARIFSPLVKILENISAGILYLLRLSDSQEAHVTQEEIKILMEQATQEGVFEESEQNMVEGVLRLGDRFIDAVMTPRPEIMWLDLEDDFDEIVKTVREQPFDVFPVARGSLDNVVGLLEARTFLASCLQGEPKDWSNLIRKPLYIPETMLALEALELIKAQGDPVALVIDEYGGLLGMVTLFDILESIVGAIAGQGEMGVEEIMRQADGSWLLDGMLPVDELKDILEEDELPDEERVGYQTLGGLLMSRLGNIPQVGQYFDWKDLRFEVIKMDGRRVEKVIIKPVKEMDASQDL